MGRQPNFLFFITDQQRADWLGCYGHPVLKTPHIDGLAARGARFEDFHTAMPVCMPNRASLLTGRYPSVHGLRHNGCVLSERASTFVEVLAAGGYRTATIGKSHLQPFTSTSPGGQPGHGRGLIEEAWKPDGDSYGECRASKVVLNLASKVVMRGKVVELPGAIWNNLQKTPLCGRPWDRSFLVTKAVKVALNLRSHTHSVCHD